MPLFQAFLTKIWWGGMASGTSVLRLLGAFLCPALLYTDLIAFRCLGAAPACGGPGGLGLCWSSMDPEGPHGHRLALHASPRAPMSLLAGHLQVSLPWAQRVPCACSEEAPLQGGREDLQELDSLDSERSPLCRPGSRYRPAGGVHGEEGPGGPHRRGWAALAAGPASSRAGCGLPGAAGRSRRPRRGGPRPGEGPGRPSCWRAGGGSGAPR